ncbi:MAG: lytic murein transglycosylase [Pseudolabrys sp.]|nr:lytic murein transglycosylase [Pseudolabrys sp.]
MLPSMRLTTPTLAALAALTLAAVPSGPAAANPAPGAVKVHDGCRNTASFERWVQDFRKDAIAQGISPAVVDSAVPYMEFAPEIIQRDRNQQVFQQSFLQFSDRMIAGHRMKNAQIMMQRHAAILAKVEKQYGIPAPVLVAFWGLESDFGTNTGKHNILRAIATLAYDCRRTEYFREQLVDALRILQRGDLTVAEMNGGDWAGELGAMQFTASDYYRSAVDYDGDGRRDLVKSVPDTLASAANFLSSFGWKRGEPWLQEVRVPANMPWEQSDLKIVHPRAQWAKWGVTGANGALPADTMEASLVLPMGRNGPAFLAYNNFKSFLGWNSALVYSTTVAYFATRIAGAPPVHRGNAPVTVLNTQQMLELQLMLARNGYDVGKPDGKLGLMTRAAVRQAQLKFGLPADSYPSLELMEKMKGSTLGAAR